ncbi:unnamed protein product, partial [Staurois parvus]
ENIHLDDHSDDIVPVTVDPNVRIVGGTDSLKGEFPWQVQFINRDREGFCGGSIVNEKWIVTAAHCFIKISLGHFSVVAGEHNTADKEGTEQYLEVARIINHPTYNISKNKYNNDIALVELEKPMVLNDYARPICIGYKDFTDRLLKIIPHSWVTGWGNLRYRGRPTVKLQKLAVPYVDRATCKKSSQYILCPQLCSVLALLMKKRMHARGTVVVLTPLISEILGFLQELQAGETNVHRKTNMEFTPESPDSLTGY